MRRYLEHQFCDACRSVLHQKYQPVISVLLGGSHCWIVLGIVTLDALIPAIIGRAVSTRRTKVRAETLTDCISTPSSARDAPLILNALAYETLPHRLSGRTRSPSWALIYYQRR
jgi:hypothetical protein